MGISSLPAASSFKTKTIETLTSGTSWTVPAGVTSVIVTTIGGGGGAFTAPVANYPSGTGSGGAIRISTVSTTPGSSISYSIGAGGAGRQTVGGIVAAQPGGNTTFTGATTGTGGPAVSLSTVGLSAGNGGGHTLNTSTGADGAAGMITLEYWV